MSEIRDTGPFAWWGEQYAFVGGLFIGLAATAMGRYELVAVALAAGLLHGTASKALKAIPVELPTKVETAIRREPVYFSGGVAAGAVVAVALLAATGHVPAYPGPP